MTQPSSSPLDVVGRFGVYLSALAGLLAFAVHARDALAYNKHNDLFIYRAGSIVGLQGRSPYNTEAIRELVAAQYPEDTLLAQNLGFFLPPQAVLVFAPFAVVPWVAAKWLWAAVTVVFAAVAAHRLPVFCSQPVPKWVPPALAFLVLVNPVVVTGMLPGQTSLPAVACVVLGELAYRFGWHRIAGLLWALPFVKPHLALPLLAIAWYLSGWRRALELAMWVAGLNLAACLVCGGSPLLLKEYVEYVSAGHTAVVFNKVEVNAQITSWNRLLYEPNRIWIQAPGPLVELSAPLVLAGYAVWGLLVAGRVWLAKSRPTRAWVVAVGFAAAPVCCQVMGYELAFLALGLPHVIDLFAARRPVTAGVILVGLGLAWAPFGVEQVIPSHRALGALLFALAVLAGGWPADREAVRR